MCYSHSCMSACACACALLRLLFVWVMALSHALREGERGRSTRNKKHTGEFAAPSHCLSLVHTKQ